MIESEHSALPSLGSRASTPVKARRTNAAIPFAPSVRARMTEETGEPRTLDVQVWARIVSPEFMDFSHATEAALQRIADMGFTMPLDFLTALDRDFDKAKIARDSMDMARDPAGVATLAVRICGILIAHSIVLSAWFDMLEADPEEGQRWQVAS